MSDSESPELMNKQNVALKQLAALFAAVEKDAGAVKASAATLNKDLLGEKDE
jgi:hypothetical protein